ncbi:MAG: murein peptide amidase A [Armatimonadetes bacterium]|nr:murein peptide amidase A [Armatimonadota bacterium]
MLAAWLLFSGTAVSAELSATDRLRIFHKAERWARFTELPTSPFLRAVFPELPRWVEVSVAEGPSISSAEPVHARVTSYGDTSVALVGSAACAMALDFTTPSGVTRARFTLRFCKVRTQEEGEKAQVGWMLADVSAVGTPERVADARGQRTIETRDFYALAGVSGGPLRVMRLGTGPNVTLLLAAIHGDERNTAPLLHSLVARLGSDPAVYEGCTVVIIPVMNPEGWARNRRSNVQGIDANRNFPHGYRPDNPARKPGNQFYRGEKPMQTPESLALVHLIESYRPDKIVSVHAPFDLINYDGPAAMLAEAMSAASGQGIAPNLGYPTPGSLGTYAGLYLGIPIVTLELPDGAADEWPRQEKALLEVIRFRAR